MRRTRERLRRLVGVVSVAGTIFVAAVGVGHSQSPGAIAPAGPQRLSRPGSSEPIWNGEVLIKFRSAVDADEVESGTAIAADRRSGLAAVLRRHRLTGGKRVFRGVGFRRLDRIVKMVSGAQPDATRLGEVLAALRARPEVEYAEPNVTLRAFGIPSDPYFNSSGAWGQAFGDLWGLSKIGMPVAWDRSKGAGVVVAVLDTGVDLTHPEIQANLWQNPGEIGLDAWGRDKRSNGLDDDNDGYVDDWQGWDFTWPSTGGNNYPIDDHGHGTHVAGTIAAVGDNGAGIVGVAPLAKIMPVKVLDYWGSGSLDNISAGIVFAANKGARVINASFGGSGIETPQTLIDAIAYAHDVKGVVFVAAAGNENADVGLEWNGTFPANIRDVITVAASDHQDLRASFSNFGGKIDVTAPGGGDSDPTGVIFDAHRSILSLKAQYAGANMTGSGQLVVNGLYLRQAGTSMAAPHVAGVAALILSQHPTYTPEQVRQAIRRGADDLGGVGFDPESGYGRLNANRATAAAAPLSVQLTDPAKYFASAALTTLRGTVAGPGLLDWQLEYGPGTAPSSWTLAASGSGSVTNGALGSWPSGQADGTYTLRLRAHSASGEYTDRLEVLVDSLSIDSPSATVETAVRGGAAVTISGTAAPAGFTSYSMWGVGDRSGWIPWDRLTPANWGTVPVINGVLGTFDTNGAAADHYTICVGLNSPPYSSKCTRVLVDPTLRPGWPKQLPAVSAGPFVAALTDHLTVADIDGDGAKELLIGYGTVVRILRGDGSDLPGWPQSVDPFSSDGTIQKSPAVGDLTGDGVPEVIAVNYWGDLYVWSANGSLLPGWPRRLPGGYGSGFGGYAIADVDGDGRNEIIATNYSTVIVMDVNGQMLPGWPKDLGVGMLNPPAIADVNGDGLKEIVVQQLGQPNTLFVYRFDGTLLPGWPRDVNPGLSGSSYSQPVVGDLDGDGASEIVVGSLDGKVYAFRGDGTQAPGWPQLTNAPGVHTAAIGDIDGDGLPEVVVGTGPDNTQQGWLHAWHGNGTSLTGWPLPTSAYFIGWSAPALADVDGDGKADVISANDSIFALEARRFDGTSVAGFPRPTLDSGAWPTNTPAVGDFDGDGSLELAWIDFQFNVYVWDLLAPASSPTPWPMYRSDAAHTGRAMPPMRRLTLTVQGLNGALGYVFENIGGTICAKTSGGSQECVLTFPLNTTVLLGAQPLNGSAFRYWQGACTGSSSFCAVTLLSDQSVTAVFGDANLPPVASAGGPYAASRNQPVAFVGSGSFDPNGDPLSYAWMFGDGSTGTGATPTHAYGAVGTYTATLVVSDGSLSSPPSSATVTITNQPPTARTGGPYSGNNGAPITFNGTASSDPDGDPINYTWNFGDGWVGSGPLAQHQYVSGGIYTVSLIVNDGLVSSPPASTAVTVSDVVPPASVADLAGFGFSSSRVTLTWTASGNDGAVGLASSYDLRYSTAPITSANFASATAAVGEPPPRASGQFETFVVPNLAPSTTYYFALKVADAAGNVSAISNVAQVATSTPVTIFADDFESGSGLWTITTTLGPPLWHLSSFRFSSPIKSFYFGSETTRTYNTGTRNAGSISSVPVILAGAQGAYLSFNYFLQKEASTSKDLARVWVSTNGGSTWIQLGPPLAPAATMTAVSFDLSPYSGQAIRIKFDFDTIDAAANSFEGWYVDDVRVLADSQLPRPIARAGGPYAGFRRQPIPFNGSLSTDPEGDPLSFDWRFGDGTIGTGPTPAHVYTSPGTYSVTLTVSDGTNLSNTVVTSAVVTNRAPIAAPGGPYFAPKNSTVSFNGTASSDPDGDPLSYSWTFGDATSGSGPNPTHAYTAAGSYNVTLTVNDGVTSSAASTTATIFDAQPPAPVTNLSASPSASRSVSVHWNASGDDGFVGTASLYDLRYSTAPIDLGNFAAATAVATQAPKPPHTLELYTVSGLQAQTTYFFALKVRDAAGNWSVLSNVANATTRPEVTLFHEDVETLGTDWTIAGSDGVGGPALWHVGTHLYASPTHAFYYGIDATHTYNSGAANSGTLTSPPISLLGAHTASMWFVHKLQTQGSATLDKATIQVSTDDGVTWATLATPVTTTTLKSVNVSLAAYEGQTIRLRFAFDTVDAVSNDFEGWVIDDVEVIAETVNRPPTADAGADQIVQPGASFTLDASGSSDPDGQTLSYTWRDATNTIVASTAAVTLSRPAGDQDFTVTVSDGELSATDTVHVHVLANRRVTLTLSSQENGRGTVTLDPAAADCSNLVAGGSLSCERDVVEAGTVTLSAMPGPDSVFEGWTGPCAGPPPGPLGGTCSFVVADDVTIGAIFHGPQQVRIDIASLENGGGQVFASDGNASWTCVGAPGGAQSCTQLVRIGSTVSLSAMPTPDSVFEGWTGPCTGPPPGPLGGTCSFVVADDVAIGAIFHGPQQVRVDIASLENGGGQVFASDGNASWTCVGAPGGAHSCTQLVRIGSTVTVSAMPTPDSVFEGWTGPCAGPPPGPLGGTCSFVVADDVAIGAIFHGPQQVRVDIASLENGGGQVFASDGSASWTCVGAPGGAHSCTQLVRIGSTVTLSAMPTPDSVFEGWTGPCTGPPPGPLGGTCSFVVADDVTIGAIFHGPQQVRVDIASLENGTGTVGDTYAGASWTCTGTTGAPQSCTQLVRIGTSLSLNALAAPGSAITEWAAACAGQPFAPDQSVCTIVVTDDVTVGVTFRGPQPLALVVEGEGSGEVQIEPSLDPCQNAPGAATTCNYSIRPATTLQLSANPAADSLFQGWTGACEGQAAVCEITIADAAATTATFVLRNHPPTAHAGGPYAGFRNAALTFNGAGSTDPDANALSYSWTFGDGASGSGVTPSHAYAALGSYAVTLIVNDGSVSSPPSTSTAIITNRPPVSNAGGPYSAVRGQAIAFSGAGSTDPDGDSLTYSWNFGDGATATGVAPAHAYATVGSFTVTLRVNDGHDDSAPATATVTITNRLPSAVVGGPYAGTRLAPIVFNGSASSDPDGDALTYEWSFGDGATGVGATPAHSYTQVGTFTVSLIVRDSFGASSPSTASVQVNNVAPSVTLTAPAPGALFLAPATLSLTATAGDSDGSIAKVEFYSGAVKIGESLAPPYGIVWSGVTAGSYGLTARAIDDGGSSVTSALVPIIVNAPPTVSLTAPANGAQFAAPASITLTASASDPDGTIAQVEFFQGATSLGIATASPYSVLWSNAPVGTYVLTARATDNRGALVTSAPITVKVTTTLAPTADASVRGGSSNTGQNFGTATTLTVQESSSSSNDRWTYVKFDLASLPSITNAKLRLFGALSATTGTTVQTAAYPVSNTTWTETGITWNNKPASGTTALATLTIVNNSTTARWYEWDVTAYLQQEKAAGRNVVTLALKNLANSTPFDSFNSKEATANRPEILVLP